MRVSELIDRIKEVLRDPATTDTQILDTANEGTYYIANMVRLPALIATSTVSFATDAAYVSLPTDFNRELFEVIPDDSTKPSIHIVNMVSDLLAWHGSLSLSGDVTTVAEENGNLWYQPIPTTTYDATIRYYSKPTELTLSSDITEIPEPYTFNSLGNYILWNLFDRNIEDALDGQKANTQYYLNAFSMGVNALQQALPNQPRYKRPFRKRFQKQFI